jgi:hypothetical protein
MHSQNKALEPTPDSGFCSSFGVFMLGVFLGAAQLDR